MAIFTGTDGFDAFHATAENDTFDGVNHDNEISYNANFTLGSGALGATVPASRTVGITANLATGAVTDSLGLSHSLLGGFTGIYATEFADTILVGDLDTIIVGFAGADTISGGNSYSQIWYDWESGGGAISADLAAGTIIDTYGDTDFVTNIRGVNGTSLADIFRADNDGAWFRGLAGNDTLYGGSSSRDELRYDRDAHHGGDSGVVVDLMAGTAVDGFGDTDTFTGFERVQGTDFNDIITGNDAANRLRSFAGDDQLFGLAGDDSFETGTGIDTADGGTGTDTAIFAGARSDYDLSFAGTTVTVALNSSGGASIATLVNMEFAEFSDQIVDLRNGASTTTYEVYRFFNTATGAHFYTASAEERDSILENLPSLQFEGNSFGSNATPENGGVAVYRFYNTATNSHFYTASESERQEILNSLSNYIEEGISYYSYMEKQDGSTELYRFYNTATGTHFYTTDITERDSVIANLPQMSYEGISYYIDFA